MSEYPLAPLGEDRESWEKRVSQEVRQLEARARSVLQRLEGRFGPEAWENPAFVRAIFGLLERSGLFPALEAVYRRAIRVPQVSDFARRLEGSLAALGSPENSRAVSPGEAVPADFRYYLAQAVEGARADKEGGLLPDLESAEVLLGFAENALEAPALEAFRRDTPGQGTLSGRRFGSYELAERVGQGGFAEVYRARHVALGVDRALKFLHGPGEPGPDGDRLRARLLEEARLQARLDHPNLVRLLEVGEEGGRLFLVMDYVEGRTLARLIHEENLQGRHVPPERVVEIALALASGLDYAHRRGVVHRDLKPENILVGADGRVRIGDFGLARAFEGAGRGRQTRTGYLVGTPQYMAPEQVGGGAQAYDPRSDLYSLGVVLYHLAAGAPPFDDEDVWSILRMHREEPPAPLSLQVEGFPEELDAVILRCLAKRPEERFSSAAELAKALEECRTKFSAAAGAKPSRKRTLAFALSAVGILGAAGTLLLPAPAAGTRRGTPSATAPAPTPTGEELRVPGGPARPSEPARETLDDPLPERAPLPALREKLAGNPPSDASWREVSRVLELFEQRLSELRNFSYDGLRAELEGLRGAGGEYAEAHVSGAIRMVELARSAFRMSLKAVEARSSDAAIRLRDGKVLKGRFEAVERGAFAVVGERGERASFPLSAIDPEALPTEVISAPAALAFGALSGSAARALGRILELGALEEEILLWVPVTTRLAAAEVREAARRAVLKSPADAGEASALVREVVTCASEVLELYPPLGPEFEAVRREKEALQAFVGRRYGEVLLRHTGTSAFGGAEKLFFEDFEAKFASGADELLAGTGWIDWEWQLHPPVRPLEERLRHWRPDPSSGGSVLEDAAGVRTLVMGRDHPGLAEGFSIEARFEPAGSEAHWKIHLGSGLYVRLGAGRVALARTVLRPGADLEIVSAALEGGREVTLAICPSECGVHVFAQGRQALAIAREDGMFPRRIAFSVARGKLLLRRAQVPKEER